MRLILLPCLVLFLCACGGPEKDIPSFAVPEETAAAEAEAPFTKGQLYCSAATQEEAQQIAELYGITLVEYRRQLALFSTQEDPDSVIQRGKAQGWPLLVRTREIQYYETSGKGL